MAKSIPVGEPLPRGIIYCIACPEGRRYIGKTVQLLNQRVRQHKSRVSQCRAIRDAFLKHGDAMKVSILLRCSAGDLDCNESIFIEKMDTIFPRGYNLRCGTHAARPTANDCSLSTFVIPEVEYADTQDEMDVAAAVKDEVNEMLEQCYLKPWTGIVKKRVSHLNMEQGGQQYCPWAGPVKKCVDSHAEAEYNQSPFPMGLAEAEYSQSLFATNAKRILEHKKATDDFNALSKKAKFDNEKLEEDHAYEKRKRDRREALEQLQVKIKILEELSMHDDANKLKHMLLQM